jgi:hypothetical protein
MRPAGVASTRAEISQPQNGLRWSLDRATTENVKKIQRRAERRSEYCLQNRKFMDIRFISSLTADDENAFAPALLKAVGAILDQFPIAYTLRVETTGSQVFQHTHHSFEPSAPAVPISGKAGRIGTLA